jgi:hypothetical protein
MTILLISDEELLFILGYCTVMFSTLGNIYICCVLEITQLLESDLFMFQK